MSASAFSAWSSGDDAGQCCSENVCSKSAVGRRNCKTSVSDGLICTVVTRFTVPLPPFIAEVAAFNAEAGAVLARDLRTSSGCISSRSSSVPPLLSEAASSSLPCPWGTGATCGTAAGAAAACGCVAACWGACTGCKATRSGRGLGCPRAAGEGGIAVRTTGAPSDVSRCGTFIAGCQAGRGAPCKGGALAVPCGAAAALAGLGLGGMAPGLGLVTQGARTGLWIGFMRLCCDKPGERGTGELCMRLMVNAPPNDGPPNV